MGASWEDGVKGFAFYKSNVTTIISICFNNYSLSIVLWKMLYCQITSLYSNCYMGVPDGGGSEFKQHMSLSLRNFINGSVACH